MQVISYIKYSWRYWIDKINVPDDYTITSLDITSMYTNLASKLILNSINKKWKELKEHTFLKKDFNAALGLCLQSSYCKFNGVLYKQIFGLPISSPFSAAAANIVMENIEKRILKT